MTRKELKAQAKDALRENFGAKMLLFIIPIIVGILGLGDSYHMQATQSSGQMTVTGTALLAFSLVSILITIISIVLIFFVLVIEVGAIFNYIKIFRGERENPRFKNIFIPFSDGTAGKIILLNLVVMIIMVILAVIPVIGWIFFVYLGLGWSQMNYVLFDQVERGEYRGVWGVLSESSALMKGRRGNYFVFLFSFFWWYLLFFITAGLVGFWFIPYQNMALISYYENVVRQ